MHNMIFITLLISIISYLPLNAQIHDTIKQKTLARTEDPVIIQGESIPDILGARITHLGLYSSYAGEIRVIPFQIDQKDDKGNYIIKKEENSEPWIPEGVFDTNDELVFKVKDTGNQVPIDSFFTDFTKAVEIEVTDPLTQDKGWVYLLLFSDKPNISSSQYIRVKFEKDYFKILAENYNVIFNRQSPLVMQNLSITEEAGGNGLDIYDRFKLRVCASAIFGSIEICRNEEDFKANILGWKIGPVRLLGTVRHSVRMVMGIHGFTEETTIYLYPNALVIPMVFNLPFNPDIILTEAHFYSGTDFNSLTNGMHFYSDKNIGGVTLDGTLSDKEINLDRRESEWMLITGTQGTWMNRVVFEGDLPIRKLLHYVDNDSEPKPPESEPGERLIGFFTPDLHKAKRGANALQTIIYIIPHFTSFNQKNVEAFMNILDHPLQYETHLLNE